MGCGMYNIEASTRHSIRTEAGEITPSGIIGGSYQGDGFEHDLQLSSLQTLRSRYLGQAIY